MNLLVKFEKRSRALWVLVGFVLIAGVGFIDIRTGFEYSFSLFYLIPVTLVAWFAGRPPGMLAALVSALVWLGADVSGGHTYSYFAVYIWNALIRVGIYAVTVYLLTALKAALERERELARLDSLTGALNSRFFSDILQLEIERSRRYHHPFTLAYFDLDNFKQVNDRFGHNAGDRVLSTVVSYARKHLRKADAVARLGGDEFVLLLPETDQAAARVVLTKIQSGLLQEIRQANWPVTVSMGALTCLEAPATTDDLVKMADDVMYAVKRDGKNAVHYATYTG
jgi:diguanylate cyclase (GGDEF)-like protein